ncbi:DUF11 domain-containing protein [Methanobrevibacter sp. A27]|uniref:DUF11 domain-containing protein n=1 Tax=Methanobrevibacter sp. A27 TaxID=1860099 RepID=UPI00084CE202|nr:DUF11 domain-containing protein [Methanobrevibacter sp. A27]OEC94423.1 hypothetical protein A9505_08755 [Methanobrevibacter sp. A27]
MLCLFTVSAKEIYVSSDGSDDLNGTDLNNPCSFHKAINISEDGDSIKMKAGNYSISEEVDKSLNISAYSDDVVNIKNKFSYVFKVKNNNSLVLNSLNFKNFNTAIESYSYPNIMIKNCLFEKSSYMCLNMRGGTTIITDSIFRNNTGSQGSAINFQNTLYKNRSYLHINNTIFDSNHGTNLGGVIYISLSNMYLYNNTFINNKAGYTGGVIFNDVSKVYDNRSRYINNGALYSGGAIYIRGDKDLGSYYGDHVEFINNSAPYKNGDSGGYGTSGGAFTAVDGGEIVLKNSVLEGNKAMSRGGAIWSDQKVSIINTLISNNSAYNETGLTVGGGLYCPLLKVNIINSTFSNNHAKEYPDIFNDITFPSVDIVENINNTDGKKISIKNLTKPVSYCLQPGILNIASSPIIETGTNKLLGSGGYFNGKPIGELLKIFIVQNYQRVLDKKISENTFKSMLGFISSGCSSLPSPFNDSYYLSHRLIKETLDEYEKGVRYPDVNATGPINWLTKKYLTFDFYQFSNEDHQDLIVFTFNESNTTLNPPINVTKKSNTTNPDFNTVVSYVITVKNTNKTSMVFDALVIDTLSEGLVYNGASHNGVYNNTTNTVTWILNIPADSEINLFVNATVEKFGKLNNTVNVFNKTANVTVNVPNTDVTKAVNVTRPSFNDTICYTITVFNRNPNVDLMNLVVRDVLDDGLVFNGASSGGVFDPISRTIIWTINITKGGQAVIYVNVTVNKYGMLVNKVFVDNKTANSTVYVPIEPPVNPDMTVVKLSLNRTVYVGNQTVFTIVVRNTGDCDLGEVFVVEKAPEGLAYSSFKGTDWSYSNGKFTYGKVLKVNESAGFEIVFDAVSPGNWTNVVVAGSNLTDNKTGNNTTKVYKPDMAVEKLSLNRTVYVGNQTVFTIVVRNTGDCDLGDVFVVEKAPMGLVYNSFKGTDWSYSNGKFTYGKVLKVNESASFDIVFDTISPGNWTNVVVAGSNVTDNKTGNNTTKVYKPPVNPPVKPPVNPPVNPHKIEKPDNEKDKIIKKDSSINIRKTGNSIFLMMLSVIISIPLIRRNQK